MFNQIFVPITRGLASAGEEDLVSAWRAGSDDLKDCLGSVVVPVGSLSIGLCRHRALLFKVRCQICIITINKSESVYKYAGTPYMLYFYLCIWKGGYGIHIFLRLCLVGRMRNMKHGEDYKNPLCCLVGGRVS